MPPVGGISLSAISVVVSVLLSVAAILISWAALKNSKRQADVAEGEHRRATEPLIKVERQFNGKAMAQVSSSNPVFFLDGPEPDWDQFVVQIENLRDTPADIVGATVNDHDGDLDVARSQADSPAVLNFPAHAVAGQDLALLVVRYTNASSGEAGVLTAELTRATGGEEWDVRRERAS